MAKEILKYLLLFVVLVIAQVVVFNHLCLFNVAIPLVFIYLIIKLPVDLSVNWTLSVAFFLGLAVDIFSNTCICTHIRICRSISPALSSNLQPIACANLFLKFISGQLIPVCL